MKKVSRRELLQCAGTVAATAIGSHEELAAPRPVFSSAGAAGAVDEASFDWIRSIRLLIAEGYTPPFYPCLDYDPEKALAIAQRLHCDSIRYPTFSYVAYFPTKTKLPHHPELGARDPFQRTIELFHGAGLKVVAYNPLNHPFMDVNSNNPEYRDWMRYDVHGQPLITRHMGFARFYEGCLNSPLREQIRERVREVVTNYPVDLMYFDGPYQGMEKGGRYCHCRYCQAAYRAARGKEIPRQDSSTTLEDEIEYQQWLREDLVNAFMREICDMVRQARPVPTVYNDTSLLSNSCRARAYRYVDGFMFEAAETPEQKLFNMRVGQSTGKVIWTYVSSHTEYNREHMKDNSVRGWYSFPIGGERLLLDGAVATAAGVGYCYWGLNRLFYMPAATFDQPSVRGLRDLFDFASRNQELLRRVRPAPQAGILTATQTISWYRGPLFVPQAYSNYFYGAYQLLKDIGFDSEPFLDYPMAANTLARYRLVYVPNAPCLSDSQCVALTDYVAGGGTLVATHLTSVADEYGRPRNNFGLSELLGAKLGSPEAVEIPDLYLRLLPSRELIPQDPQVMQFSAGSDATVLAETYNRGARRALGHAIIRRRHGRGQVIYIGSGLEAVYEETLLEPLRTYFHSLLDPVLGPARTYEVEFRRGLMPEFTASENTLLLHLLANTGSIWKKILVQEEFMPVKNVRVRLRLPAGKTAKSVSLMWSSGSAPWSVRNGWVELTVPQVLIYEAIRVDLG
jgi:hypothetical protein